MAEHTFVMDLKPGAASSKIEMDGTDISRLLSGVAVTSYVGQGTFVELQPGKNCSAKLVALLPQSKVTVRLKDADQLTAAAPDMLRALLAIQSQCAGHSDEFSRCVWVLADVAIAKTEGRRSRRPWWGDQ